MWNACCFCLWKNAEFKPNLKKCVGILQWNICYRFFTYIVRYLLTGKSRKTTPKVICKLNWIKCFHVPIIIINIFGKNLGSIGLPVIFNFKFSPCCLWLSKMASFVILGEALFVSATYRLYKVPQDDPSEAGSLVTYKGKWRVLTTFNAEGNNCLQYSGDGQFWVGVTKGIFRACFVSKA